MRRIGLALFALAMALALLVPFGWRALYPSPSDPKNLKYVLWKAGMYRIDLDVAADTMIGDSGRDRLVLGRTELELQERFGYLLKPADASEYLRGCYQNSPWKDKPVFFIRKSPWMVVFDKNRAAKLVLVKGC